MPTADLYAEDFPHGTAAGYDRGCRGAACELHADPSWLSCKEAKFRRNGDYSLRDHPLDQRIPRDRPASTPTKTTPISKPIPQPAFAEPITPRDVGRVKTLGEEPMPEQPLTDRPGGVALDKHGTYSGYVAGCRLRDDCPGIARVGQSCAAASAAYKRELKTRKETRLEQVRTAPVEPPAPDPVEPPAVLVDEALLPESTLTTEQVSEGLARVADAIVDGVAAAAAHVEREIDLRTPSRAGSAASGGDTSAHRTLELTIILDGQQLAALTVTANKSTAEIHHDMDGLVVVARTW